MDVRLIDSPDCLHAVVDGLDDAADATRAIERLFAEGASRGATRAVVAFRHSAPLFKVEKFGLSAWLERLAGVAGMRIALVADSPEMLAAQEYVALLAAQRGVTIAAFRDEASAFAWLDGPAR